jgi:hypothetical protein
MVAKPAPVDRWFIPLFIGVEPSFWWCRILQPSTVSIIIRLGDALNPIQALSKPPRHDVHRKWRKYLGTHIKIHWEMPPFSTAAYLANQLKDPTSVPLELPKPHPFLRTNQTEDPHIPLGWQKLIIYVYWNYQDIMELC